MQIIKITSAMLGLGAMVLIITPALARHLNPGHDYSPLGKTHSNRKKDFEGVEAASNMGNEKCPETSEATELNLRLDEPILEILETTNSPPAENSNETEKHEQDDNNNHG